MCAVMFVNCKLNKAYLSIYELPVIISTPTVKSATQISYKLIGPHFAPRQHQSGVGGEGIW